jgi:hypothetical protein
MAGYESEPRMRGRAIGQGLHCGKEHLHQTLGGTHETASRRKRAAAMLPRLRGEIRIATSFLQRCPGLCLLLDVLESRHAPPGYAKGMLRPKSSALHKHSSS